MRWRPSVLTMTGKRSSPYFSARFGQSGGRMWAWVSILSIPASLTGVPVRNRGLDRRRPRRSRRGRRRGGAEGGRGPPRTGLLRGFCGDRREVEVLIVVAEIGKRR